MSPLFKVLILITLKAVITASDSNKYVSDCGQHDKDNAPTHCERRVDSTDDDESFTFDMADVPMSPLLAQTYEGVMEPHPQQLAPGVWAFIGYSWVNMGIIEAPEGLILVDTTESVHVAERILKDFRKLSNNNKPVKAVIYTHSHADHIYGTRSFVDDSEVENLEVWAFAEYGNLDNTWSYAHTTIGQRTYHLIGALIPLKYSNGAHLLRVDPGEKPLITPNRFIHQKYEKHIIAGKEIHFVHVPGETNDMIAVWLPDSKVLYPGDDFYRSFVNIVSPRGHIRDIQNWTSSVDKFRELRPAAIVPGHWIVETGEENVYNLLTAWRDGIQFVHDQTVRYINKGLDPDAIYEKIVLPPNLAKCRYVWDTYGKKRWLSGTVFHKYLGWYSGNPTDIRALTRRQRAKKIIELFGEGEAAIKGAIRHARLALAKDDEENIQWALELATGILLIDPGNKAATKTHYLALKASARVETSVAARLSIMSKIIEMYGGVKNPLSTRGTEAGGNKYFRFIPFDKVLIDFTTHVKGEESTCNSQDIKVTYKFTDSSPEAYSMHLRNGIAQITPGVLSDADFVVTTTETIWREILFGNKFSNLARGADGVTIDGNTSLVDKFFSCFDEYE